MEWIGAVGNILLFFGVALAYVHVGKWVFHQWFDRYYWPRIGLPKFQAEQEAFIRAHPSGCTLCGLHAFGYKRGFETSPTPKPHQPCPWRETVH